MRVRPKHRLSFNAGDSLPRVTRNGVSDRGGRIYGPPVERQTASSQHRVTQGANFVKSEADDFELSHVVG